MPGWPLSSQHGKNHYLDTMHCERGVKIAKATATIKSAGTSPAKCPICPGWVTAWTAMIAPCTTLDQTVNQIRLRLANGSRGQKQEHAKRGVDANDHHRVVRVTDVPGPAGRPEQHEWVESKAREASQDQNDAQIPEAIGYVHGGILFGRDSN